MVALIPVRHALLLACTVVLSWYVYLTWYDFPAPYSRLPGCDASVEIPRHIWTFWDSDEVPIVVRECVATWREWCPGYAITLITPRTLAACSSDAQMILGLPYASTPQRLADYVRLHVLHEHGGYWLDASVILTGSLDHFAQVRGGAEFVGYYHRGLTRLPSSPAIENWFFGCIPRSPLIRRWRDIFMEMNRYTTCVTYVEHARMCGVQLGIPRPLCYYLTMHVAMQALLQRCPSALRRCAVSAAEDGPLAYLAATGWDSQRGVASLGTESDIPAPIIKLRGRERAVLSSMCDHDRRRLFDRLAGRPPTRAIEP